MTQYEYQYSIQQQKGGFYFIANLLDIQLSLPIEITPTIRIEKASDSQIEIIRSHIEETNFYESQWVKNQSKEETSSVYSINRLPKEEWNYNIISFSGNHNAVVELLALTELISPYIVSFAHFYTTEEFGTGHLVGRGFDPIGSPVFYQGIGIPSIKILDDLSLARLKDLLDKYKSLDREKHEGIIRAIEFNSDLKRLSLLNNLPILGLFIIIEMLLTHLPNNKELGDSISHQIRTKIALLSERFSEPLDYSVFGNGISPDTAWSKLYEYRSSIAHGNHIDFSKGSLNALKDQSIAYKFLNSATRTILIQALTEPDLINGLKPI